MLKYLTDKHKFEHKSLNGSLYNCIMKIREIEKDKIENI